MADRHIRHRLKQSPRDYPGVSSYDVRSSLTHINQWADFYSPLMDVETTATSICFTYGTTIAAKAIVSIPIAKIELIPTFVSSHLSNLR
jgi:hypothetical protein